MTQPSKTKQPNTRVSHEPSLCVWGSRYRRSLNNDGDDRSSSKFIGHLDTCRQCRRYMLGKFRNGAEPGTPAIAEWAKRYDVQPGNDERIKKK